MPIGNDTYAWRRWLPHLQRLGKTYFVTFRSLRPRVLLPGERDIALEVIVHAHRADYWLHTAVVMPDHVHLVFTPHDEVLLPKAIQRIKSVSAHLIGTGRVWQREYFDRVIRRSEDLRRKCEYICMNPVRAGLVCRIDDYRWIWRSWIEGETWAAGPPPV